MINNVIEVWYWTIVLALLTGFAIYFTFHFVRNLWVAAREQMSGTQAIADLAELMQPYSRRMVVAHWLTLVLLFVVWYLGEMLVDARLANAAPLTGYFAHAVLGGAVLFLTILRLTYRSIDRVPPPVSNTPIEMVGRGVHYSLYVLLVLVAVSGFMVVLTSSVGEALVTGAAIVLPHDYAGPSAIPHLVHETLVTVGIALIVLHILGASRHQFILRDGLMRRMWLNRKKPRTTI